MDTETNTPSEQVVTPEVETEIKPAEETLTNDSELSQEQARYDKAFEDMDMDNPDMSIFGETTNVEENPVEVPKDVVVENEAIPDTPVDPFAIDEDGYLTQVLKDRGKEVRVTPEEALQFAHKGLNYEADKAAIKPFKPFIKILEAHPDISVEDLTSLADLASGKKEALKHLIAKYDVDVYDVDASEEKYTPKVEASTTDPVADIWSDYQVQHPEDAEGVANAFNAMDEGFRQEIYNERTFPLFADDVNKGVFDKLYPETMKIKALYPQATWLEAYSEANNRLSQSVQKKKEVPEHIDAPRDIGSKSTDVESVVNSIWDDPEVYDKMARDLEY